MPPPPPPPTEPDADAATDPAGHFARGVAHFNAGEYWEAHEAWEALWLEAYDDHKRWLQGLIQYAAALFHFERGFFASGFQRLMHTATEKVAGYDGTTHGMDWPALQDALAPWIDYGRAVAAGAAFPEAPAPHPTIQVHGP